LPLHESGKVHINPVVFKKFDGKDIGRTIEGRYHLDSAQGSVFTR